jgi:hypothetical protein
LALAAFKIAAMFSVTFELPTLQASTQATMQRHVYIHAPITRISDSSSGSCRTGIIKDHSNRNEYPEVPKVDHPEDGFPQSLQAIVETELQKET